MIPKEGSNIWIDSWVIPKNAEHKENAEKFINFLCRPDVSAANLDYIGYSTPETAAKEYMDEEVTSSPVAYPDPSVLERSEAFEELGIEATQTMNDLWLSVKTEGANPTLYLALTLAAIAAVDGVEAVQPVKYQDVEAQWQGQSETAVVRLQQLPADPGADTAENMDRLVLLSGRMPEAPDECVVHVMGYGDPVEPGTVLTLPEDTEHVSRKQFTVVGTVQDPQHFSTDKESSTAGAVSYTHLTLPTKA